MCAFLFVIISNKVSKQLPDLSMPLHPITGLKLLLDSHKFLVLHYPFLTVFEGEYDLITED